MSEKPNSGPQKLSQLSQTNTPGSSTPAASHRFAVHTDYNNFFGGLRTPISIRRPHQQAQIHPETSSFRLSASASSLPSTYGSFFERLPSVNSTRPLLPDYLSANDTNTADETPACPLESPLDIAEPQRVFPYTPDQGNVFIPS